MPLHYRDWSSKERITRNGQSHLGTSVASPFVRHPLTSHTLGMQPEGTSCTFSKHLSVKILVPDVRPTPLFYKKESVSS